MAILDLESLTTFDREVKFTIPNPRVMGAELDIKLKVTFNYLDDDEYLKLLEVREGQLVTPQREVCERIVNRIDKDEVKGADSDEEAKAKVLSKLAIQNAIVKEYNECISGFSRKNSKR